MLFRFKKVRQARVSARFLGAIRRLPDIQVILDNRYSGATAREARSTALKMLDKLKDADGIFCSTK